MNFNGLGMNLGNLSRLSKTKTRSVSAENPTGEKGKGGMPTEKTGANCARDPGQGWKVSPSVVIEPGQTYTLADIDGPSAIQSMWFSVDVARKGPLARFYISRIYLNLTVEGTVTLRFLLNGAKPYSAASKS